MSKKRGHGDGGIYATGENSWRLRYRVNGKRFSKAFHGTLSEARKELRALIRSGDIGEHVAPGKMTVDQWAQHWLSIGAPGRRQRNTRRRSVARYGELLRCHVLPTLGARRLQHLQSTEIDNLLLASHQSWHPRRRTMCMSCLALASRWQCARG